MLWSLLETFWEWHHTHLPDRIVPGVLSSFFSSLPVLENNWHIDSHASKALHLRNFLYFCGSSNVVVVRWLLRYSASPFAHDSNNTTAVHASWHHSEIQKWRFTKMLDAQGTAKISKHSKLSINRSKEILKISTRIRQYVCCDKSLGCRFVVMERLSPDLSTVMFSKVACRAGSTNVLQELLKPPTQYLLGCFVQIDWNWMMWSTNFTLHVDLHQVSST